MSWGYKITILYAGFVLLITTMVVASVRQKVDLETDDYYDQELKFQQKIDRVRQTGALETQPTWEVQPGALLLRFPAQFDGKPVSGSICFFRPSDKALDTNVLLPVTTGGTQCISTRSLKKGVYKMQLSWHAGTAGYYNEGILQIK